jgi:DNA processing protein
MQGDAGRVLEALGHDPAGVDALTARTGLAAEVVTVALVELELSGRINAACRRCFPARALRRSVPI